MASETDERTAIDPLTKIEDSYQREVQTYDARSKDIRKIGDGDKIPPTFDAYIQDAMQLMDKPETVSKDRINQLKRMAAQKWSAPTVVEEDKTTTEGVRVDKSKNPRAYLLYYLNRARYEKAVEALIRGPEALKILAKEKPEREETTNQLATMQIAGTQMMIDLYNLTQVPGKNDRDTKRKTLLGIADVANKVITRIAQRFNIATLRQSEELLGGWLYGMMCELQAYIILKEMKDPDGAPTFTDVRKAATPAEDRDGGDLIATRRDGTTVYIEVKKTSQDSVGGMYDEAATQGYQIIDLENAKSEMFSRTPVQRGKYRIHQAMLENTDGNQTTVMIDALHFGSAQNLLNKVQSRRKRGEKVAAMMVIINPKTYINQLK